MPDSKDSDKSGRFISSFYDFHMRILLLTVLFGGIVRLAFVYKNNIIGTDSVTYVELGINLVQGYGYEASYLLPHPELVKAPLYPVLTGGVWSIVGDGFLAAKIVSLIFGVLLIPLIYLLGRTIYDRSVGLFSAILVAFHPLLINISSNALADSTYTFLIASVCLIGYIAFRRESVGYYILLGCGLGMAFLSKHIAMGYLGVVSVTVLIYEFDNTDVVSNWFIKSSTRIAAVGFSFLAVATPYLFFLYRRTGEITFGKKSSINLLIGERVTSSDPLAYEKIAYGLTGDLQRSISIYTETGTLEYILANPTEMIVRYMFNTYNLYDHILSEALTVVYLLLIGLGLFTYSWSKDRSKTNTYLLLWVLYPLIVLPLFFITSRFIAPLIPIFTIWAAVGLKRVKNWGDELGNNIDIGIDFPIIGLGVIGFLIILLIGLSVAPVIGGGTGPVEHKAAGEWLDDESKSNDTIMLRKPFAAYYGDVNHIALPYANYSEVVQYGCENDVDYLLIDERYTQPNRPQLSFLLDDSQAPEEDLSLIYESREGQDILIYELHCSPR